MAWIMDTVSMHAGHSVTASVTGKPTDVGGSEGRQEAAGRGVTYLTLESLKYLHVSEEPPTVAVQGFGKVGSSAARLLHEAGEAASAAEHYRRALEARPDDGTAAFNLGVALEDLGRRAEAIAAYQLAISTDPHCADAHYNLSRLYEHLGQGAPALRHLRTYRALTGHA